MSSGGGDNRIAMLDAVLAAWHDCHELDVARLLSVIDSGFTGLCDALVDFLDKHCPTTDAIWDVAPAQREVVSASLGLFGQAITICLDTMDGMDQRMLLQALMQRVAFAAQEECPICFSNSCDTVTPCRHGFCHSCIAQSINQWGKCSICNTRLQVDDLQPAAIVDVGTGFLGGSVAHSRFVAPMNR